MRKVLLLIIISIIFNILFVQDRAIALLLGMVAGILIVIMRE